MSNGTTIPIQPSFAPARLPDNGKRFYIWTIGCQMNEADSAKVAATLQEAGYRRTDEENEADIVVLNGDPLADVSNLLNVAMVVKGGELVVDKR